MLSNQSAKSIASRLDHAYVRKHPYRRWLRRGLIFVACLSVLLVLGAYARKGDQTIYSPGTLTSVHAMLDGNQCSWCHEQLPDGGFSNVVTDNACTRCHDGAIHHPNQITLVSLDANKTPVRSADCVVCHVEHRGHEQLVSSHDSQCTQCHGDLAAATRGGKTDMPSNVHGFAVGAHPPFGRGLTDEKSWSAVPALRDPTPLKYNHSQAAHLAIKPLAGQANNCTVCHESSSDRLGGQDVSTIAPVSFDRHCASCHKIELIQGGGIVLPHESFDVVRGTLAGVIPDLRRRLRAELDAMSPEDRTKALVTVRMIRQPPPRPAKREEVRITPEQWVDQRVAAVTSPLKKWYEEVGPTIPGFDVIKSAVEGGGSATPATAPAAEPPVGSNVEPWTDPRVLELMVAKIQPGIKSQNRCNLCHELTDDAGASAKLRQQAGAPMNAAALLWTDLHSNAPGRMRSEIADRFPATTGISPETQVASTQPATPATAAAITGWKPVPRHGPLDILPTGIGTGPRRWYTSSRFDHGAHRFMSCVDCHGKAAGSAFTSDVLLPTMESCVSCHAPRTTGTLAGGATTSCTACHSYHDHSREWGTRSIKASDLGATAPPRPPMP